MKLSCTWPSGRKSAGNSSTPAAAASLDPSLKPGDAVEKGVVLSVTVENAGGASNDRFGGMFGEMLEGVPAVACGPSSGRRSVWGSGRGGGSRKSAARSDGSTLPGGRGIKPRPLLPLPTPDSRLPTPELSVSAGSSL